MALIKIVVYTEDNEVEKDMVINDDNLFNTLYEITAEYNNEITIFAGYDASEDMRCIELRIIGVPFRLTASGDYDGI